MRDGNQKSAVLEREVYVIQEIVKSCVNSDGSQHIKVWYHIYAWYIGVLKAMAFNSLLVWDTINKGNE